ncbi:putative tail protein [Brevundimonas phage vB_BpoS-Marchewka]|uniref:Tail protein n=1 Tax=Brevundimonas phage vB_BpoS-Marchewka TaxID=2948604 RepID=A0A9E7N5Z4_9CAUD|nr:putative tail protein [Brevundimonas phage vB_BpoS-Marchewka]
MADPFSMAMMAVAQVGISYLFPSEGPRLKDLKISASTYGAAIPWVFGLTRVPGNMIWSMPIRENKKKKSGKGGYYNQYTYFCTFAMGLCQGPVREIRRIWADNKLIYDATGGVSPTQATQPNSVKEAITQRVTGQGVSKYRMRFYRGDEDQLPDSAIETNLGEGNAPAFRGLAYILFDDMPLEDFGNRIPQITAEVMVGEQTTTVVVTPLTEQDGVTDLDRERDQGEAVFDFPRAIFYLRYDDAIKSVSLRDGKARVFYPAETLGYPEGERLNRLLCGGVDGSLFTLFGPEGGPNALGRLDPFSLQLVATHTPSLQYVRAAPASASNGAMRVLAVDGPGVACLHDAATLDVLWTGSLGSGARMVGRDPTDIAASAIFYVVRPTGASLRLSRVTADGIEDLAEIEGTEVGPVLWDAGMPGVLIFMKRGGQAYLTKWNEDTGAVAWSRAIPGYPPQIAPESRTLESQLAWLVEGRVYLLDTATGTPIDGEDAGEATGTPDWADYLARYPQVLADYYEFGWAYADSPEAYAQHDYMSGGQAAGRTVNMIESTQGAGIPLKEPYVGGVATLQAIDAQRGLLIALDGVDGVVKATNIATGVSVGTIVARLLEEGGMPLMRTDLSALYAIPIRGYGWASATDIKGVLDELRRLFLFDLVEREGLLVASMRADDTNGMGVPVEVIPQAALGSSSPEATDFWSETRLQEADLPARVTISYMNVDRDFETSTAHSVRIASPVPTMFSRQQVSMEINIVMAAKEAKAQVHKMLYAQWAERVRHRTFLPWSYLMLDPGDTINVRMDDGRLYEDRIDRTEIGADFIMGTECYAQDSGAYDGWDEMEADGGAGSGGSSAILPPGLALPFVFNTPLMRDMDDQGGSASIYYVGLGNGMEQTWTGGALLRSVNNLDYDVIPSPDSDLEWGTVIGDVLPPPPFGAYALDWTSRLTIRPAVGWFVVESVTDDELWAGANLALVGDEIIQFRDCVENEDGTWSLWNLLRARRGTEYACDGHKAGERFVFLSSDTVGFAVDQTSARGQARFFKAVASGGSLATQGVLSLAYEPRDLMPYPPADLRRAKAETTNDFTVTWSRCTRFGGNMQDGTGEVPLAERIERYEAYVLDAPFDGDRSRGRGPETYRRRYETATPQFVYDTAAQAEDGFDPLTDTLHLVIYQLSDAVGRGFPALRSVAPDETF